MRPKGIMYDVICDHTSCLGIHTRFVVKSFEYPKDAIEFSVEYAAICSKYENKREKCEIVVKSRYETDQEHRLYLDKILLTPDQYGIEEKE